METKLKRIAKWAESDSNLKFSSLAHLLNEENLKQCYYELGKDKAPGVDGKTWEEYGESLEENISDLVERLKAKKYWPKPVRRTYIPKEGKDEERPIGIPALEDKIVQLGISKILTAIYEADFLDTSFGFRPERSPHDALRDLDRTIMTEPVNWILDADIKGFFDHVDHDWMIRCLKERISDTTLLKLINRFLKAGIVEEGRLVETEVGTPQGGNLSPVLSNIYLHYVLDLWVAKKLRDGYVRFVNLIRFADDFVVLFSRKGEAEYGFQLLKGRLAKFGLALSEEKTHLIEFGRYARKHAARLGDKPDTFDFLGFTHYCDVTRDGGFKLSRRTSSKKFSAKLNELKKWIRDISKHHPPREWWPTLRAKLVGHFRYFGVTGNFSMIYRFWCLVEATIFKWLNRRSQKRSYNWAEYVKYLERHPLPKPRIYHNLYTLSSKG